MMSAEDYNRYPEIKTILHHIYEYKKGVRSLVLCTLCRTCATLVVEKLSAQGIPHLQQELGTNRVNLYFGKQACLDAVSNFAHKPLNRLTPEEDFMLGAMLGYDITMQCERFCNRKSKAVVN